MTPEIEKDINNLNGVAKDARSDFFVNEDPAGDAKREEPVKAEPIPVKNNFRYFTGALVTMPDGVIEAEESRGLGIRIVGKPAGILSTALFSSKLAAAKKEYESAVKVAENCKDRIKELDEKKIPAAKEKLSDADKNVAKVIAAGGDVNAALDKRTAAESALKALTAALPELDKNLLELSTDARRKGFMFLDIKVSAEYAGIESDINKIIQAIIDNRSVIGASTDGIAENCRQQIEAAVWQNLLAGTSKERQDLIKVTGLPVRE